MDTVNFVIDNTILNPAVQRWMSVLFTIMMLSFLYRDNPLYKLGENTFLGISLGFGWVWSWNRIIVPYLFVPLKDSYLDFQPYDLTLVLWVIIGSTMFFRFSRNKGWIANYWFAFVFAYVAGYSIPISVQALFIQGANMMKPLLEYPTFFEISKWFVIIFGTFAGLMYFFFSKPHRGLLGKTARIGILILMINFGASFGATVMGRIALFIGRAQVLADNIVPSIIITLSITIYLFIYFKYIKKEPGLDDELMH
ncbi:MAG TPA: hypothetical protein PKW56_03845 [Clostridiales bacterium]|nr:hypothetical protein [Clostridiales bacterium]